MLKITPLLFILTAIFAAAETHLLKVMSFNIRYGAANDGSNSWPNRKDLVLETIKASDPDLLGLQEVLGFQADFLKENLPGYAFHGVGREDGKEKGEYVPLMYKTSRFALERSGHFWFS
ncbi:endonuclease/exonuclease/phosphatase family protein, partial [Akkermansiaceae bacterium]|nr:endonuclease/exonuclease/phosphatase family protein [Akkermansiaceae bacterium]